MANKELEELAHYLLQHSADDDPPQLTPEAQAWAYSEVIRIQRETIARLEAALDAILSIEQHGGDKHAWSGGHDYAVRMLQEIARMAKSAAVKARKP